MSSYVSILLSPPKHILDKFLRIFFSFSKNKTMCSEYYGPSCIVSLTYSRLLVASDRKPCTNWLSTKKGNLLACITETSKKSHWFQAQLIGGSNVSKSWSRLPGLYLPLQQCFRRVFSIEYILPPSSPTSPHSRRSTSRHTSQYLGNTAGKELMAVSLQESLVCLCFHEESCCATRVRRLGSSSNTLYLCAVEQVVCSL